MTTLLITVLGTVLAVFVADVVSHMAVHAVLPGRAELRHMLQVSFGAMGTLVVPFISVGLAAAGVGTIEGALRVSTVALVLTLGAVGYLAVRRVPMPR